jgi:two-component system LytT family response regulator
MIKALIIEDEKIAREVLGNYLKKYCPIVNIVGEAADYHEAVLLIKKEQPQLVFLDIEMPHGNGFDVLDACREVTFETIFITAYASYAIKALNKAAAYYLMKPVSIDELIASVEKARIDINNKTDSIRNKIIIENLNEKNEGHQQIVLPTLEGFDIVKTDIIIRLQGSGNFTDLFLAGKKKKMVCRFLKYFEEVLPSNFVRVHKSHIVNLHSVTSYHKGKGGYLVLEDNTEIEVSSTYKADLINKLKVSNEL